VAKKLSGRSDQMRSAIAQEAARLMAEHGIHDFLTAKRKAAERFGVSDVAVLPRNIEVEAALNAHHRLFGGAQHGRTLTRQREAALRAMELLKDFQPRLVGPVLTGSATEHSDIQLHVFADPAESVYILLMDRNVPHEVMERRVKMQTDRQIAVPGLRFEVAQRGVEVLVFPRDGIRQAPVSPVDGKPMRRADAAEVRLLLESATAGLGLPAL
jgi:predicted nucleotidyltransferase